jgi:hypothetical protein
MVAAEPRGLTPLLATELSSACAAAAAVRVLLRCIIQDTRAFTWVRKWEPFEVKTAMYCICSMYPLETLFFVAFDCIPAIMLFRM